MTKYVCGFAFDHLLQSVALVWKNKPKWQEGKLNGIGGKIEQGELPIDAMRREFKEETGHFQKDWKPLIILSGNDWIVHFFWSVVNADEFEYIETKEEEEIAKIRVDMLDNFDYIPNLRWLIPMAIYAEQNPKDTMSFYIIS